MEKEKQKIVEAKEILIRATKLLSDVIEDGGDEDMKLEDWMKDRVEFWCRIYNKGGVISKTKVHEIWEKELGKDVRGLGGFFVGRGASLQWTADGKVVLTSAARNAIEAWTGKSIEELAKKYKK